MPKTELEYQEEIANLSAIKDRLAVENARIANELEALKFELFKFVGGFNPTYYAMIDAAKGKK